MRDKLFIIRVPGTVSYQVCKDEEELSIAYVPLIQLEALQKLTDELREAATALRIAQKAYMADRGNNDKGKAVGEAAKVLDAVLDSDYVERAPDVLAQELFKAGAKWAIEECAKVLDEEASTFDLASRQKAFEGSSGLITALQGCAMAMRDAKTKIRKLENSPNGG